MIQDSRFGFSGRTLHTEYARTASNWQSSYAFYLQGFSYAHVEAYQKQKEKMKQKGQTSTEYLVILAMTVIGVTHVFAPQYMNAMVQLFKEPTAVVHQTTSLKKGD